VLHLAVPAVVLAGSPGCQGNSACLRAPAGSVTVFLEAGGPSAAFSASVAEVTAPAEGGLWRYRLREASGAEHVLVFRAPEEAIPLETGTTYEFALETVPGMPTPASIVVRDEQGLLYASVSDYRPGERVLQGGLPEFSIELTASDCADRAEDPCLESDVNAILRVEHANATAGLFHGDGATLGAYRVRCLTARTVTYRAGCADAGVFGVSYTIRRVP
jgi:hypothetical protein